MDSILAQQIHLQNKIKLLELSKNIIESDIKQTMDIVDSLQEASQSLSIDAIDNANKFLKKVGDLSKEKEKIDSYLLKLCKEVIIDL